MSPVCFAWKAVHVPQHHFPMAWHYLLPWRGCAELGFGPHSCSCSREGQLWLLPKCHWPWHSAATLSSSTRQEKERGFSSSPFLKCRWIDLRLHLEWRCNWEIPVCFSNFAFLKTLIFIPSLCPPSLPLLTSSLPPHPLLQKKSLVLLWKRRRKWQLFDFGRKFCLAKYRFPQW